MNNRGRQPGRAVRVVMPEERAAFARELEQQNPGYLDENLKLTAIVRILTGMRILYGLFYLLMAYLYGLEMAQGWLNLLGAFFFFLWYSFMLRSGRIVAVAMLVFRGISISMAGPSILGMSFYLPLPLIFTLVLAAVMEFIEAVFCIYTLFNVMAARTIRLNRTVDRQMSLGVPKSTLEKMAEYQNPWDGTGEGDSSAGEGRCGGGAAADSYRQKDVLDRWERGQEGDGERSHEGDGERSRESGREEKNREEP